jgi:predicted nuclease of predicted toxin-antitoxin system
VRFKVDENLPRRIVTLLTECGHDSMTVRDEGLAGRHDDEISAAAASEGRMLLTLDRGFGDMRRYPAGTHPGILVIRPGDQSASIVEETLRAVLTDYDLDTLNGCIIVAQPGAIRIRRPTVT